LNPPAVSCTRQTAKSHWGTYRWISPLPESMHDAAENEARKGTHDCVSVNPSGRQPLQRAEILPCLCSRGAHPVGRHHLLGSNQMTLYKGFWPWRTFVLHSTACPLKGTLSPKSHLAGTGQRKTYFCTNIASGFQPTRVKKELVLRRSNHVSRDARSP
jgi:hypothetical protein